MDLNEYVHRIEVATKQLLAPPNLVSPESRREADEILLSFRQSKEPYDVCKVILERSDDIVKFQASTALKQAITREWNSVRPEKKVSLQQFILTFICDRPYLVSPVRESLCNVLAVMMKRSCVDNADASQRTPFYDHLAAMVSSGDQSKPKIACSILSALCMEFSASDKSSNVGLTWEQHAKCKRQFEEHDLYHIFGLVLQVLRHLEMTSSETMSNAEASLCEKLFVVTEQIFTWHFTPTTYYKRAALFADSTLSTSFKPGRKWAPILFDPNFLQFFFKLHVKARKTEWLCHGSMTCLSQLASLQGPIFAEPTQAVMYLANFLQGFLHTYADGNVPEPEALGVSNIVSNLLDARKLEVWIMLPGEQNLFPTFLQTITQITCNFCKAATEVVEQIYDDDNIYMEAYETILNAWTILTENMAAQDKKTFLAPCATTIIEGFIHCHLSPPEGIRPILSKEDQEVIDELESPDLMEFYSQLVCIATFARIIPQTILPVMCRLIETHTERLRSQLQLALEQKMFVLEDNQTLCDLNENLHWLVMLSGFILSDDCEGETSLIPSEIIKCSIQQKPSVDENTSLLVLGSPKQSISEIPGAENSTDYVIRLVASIIKLSEVESQALNSNMSSLLSPQLSQDIMWFYRTWTDTYLVFKEEYYEEISPVFSKAFGQHSEGAKWFVNHFCGKVITMLSHWTSETEVLFETTKLLRTLVMQDESCSLLVENSDFWQFCAHFCSNAAPFNSLSCSSKQSIATCIVSAGSAKMNVYKDKYWKQTLEPIQNQFTQLLSKDGFQNAAHSDVIREQIAALLTLFHGVAVASQADNTTILFEYLSPMLQGGSQLYDIYHNYDDLVLVILEIFTEVAHKQVCHLKQSQCSRLYEWSMSLLQSYSKHTIGRSRVNCENDDESQDFILIIELLTHLLAKDFIDFSDTDTELQAEVVIRPDKNEVSAADVVLFGLNIVLPLVSSRLLLYPLLCTHYYKLITFLCEIYPEKIENLSDDMLQCFIQTLQSGLGSFGSDNCKLCLEAVESLAAECLKSRHKDTRLYRVMISFVRLVFDTMIVHACDNDLLQTAGETFYVILCVYPEQVLQLFHMVVESQVDPEYKSQLSESFNNLVPDISKVEHNRTNRTAFIRRLESAIFSIRGILCIR